MTLSLPRTLIGAAVTAFTLLAFGIPASAQIQNGSFETDPFGSSSISQWNLSGSAVITDSSFGDAPPDGLQQAFLNNNPNTGAATNVGGLESFFGLTSGVLTGLGNGTVTNGSGLSQTFTLTQAGTLSFDYDFVTSEDPTYPNSYHNDFAFVSLTGSSSLLSSLADTTAATTFEPLQTGRNSPSIDDYLTETGYKTYTAVLSPGTYQLGLGVVNVGSSDIGSGLLVDNARFTPVPEAGTAASFGLLLSLAGLLLFVRRAKQSA